MRYLMKFTVSAFAAVVLSLAAFSAPSAYADHNGQHAARQAACYAASRYACQGFFPVNPPPNLWYIGVRIVTWQGCRIVTSNYCRR